MTVPSQFKGFSRLPEEVQRKMSPELANKYNMGGDVLQRPLFRQMGGPAEAMPPAPMPAPPPPMPAPQGPDPMMQQAEAQMQGVGEQFAQQTMANLDQAEDIEGAINALRGNAKPIEARYDELAGFVGQGDAQQTPESVLAMVQPTIMMTEQGAMDSGIGELIQSVAGSEMETPTGEPTAMGQGVGELMAMGAGNTPPVNFNQGGPVEVRRYAQGDPQGVTPIGADAFKSAFADILPMIQAQSAGILGTPEERARELEEAKRFQRGQAGLDLAKFGLALASPTDQPMSFAEKLAAAGQPLATSLGERAQALQDVKRAQTAEERALAMQNVGAATNIAGDLYGKIVEQGMQGQRLETQLTIAQMNNSSREKIAQLGTANATELAKLNADLRRELLATTNAHDKKKYESNQEHEKDLKKIIETMTLNIDANKARLAKEGNESLARLNSELTEQRDKLLSQQRMDERADELGIIHSNDLKKLDKSFENQEKLITHSSQLELHKQNVQRSFTATQNALNRVLELKKQDKSLTSQELQNQLNRELQKELADDANALNAAQFRMNFLIKERGLTIEAAKNQITKEYYDDLIEVQNRELEAKGLLNDVNSRVIRYISDPDRIQKYKTGTLGKEKGEFEMQLLSYVKTKTYLDPESGMEIISRDQLIQPVLDAVKTQNPQLYEQITGMPVGDVETGPIEVEKDTSEKTEAPDKLFKTNNQGLITLDTESKKFLEGVASPIFDPNLDHSLPIGLSRLPSGSKAIISGAIQEVTGEPVTDQDVINYKQAQNNLGKVANKLFTYLEKIGANFQDAGATRTLKNQQIKLEEEAERIRPGGLIFKNDLDALSAFSSFEEQIKADIEVLAKKVPQFSGVPGGAFKREQVTKARALINDLLPLYKDIRNYANFFRNKITTAPSLQNVDQNKVRTNIRNLLQFGPG